MPRIRRQWVASPATLARVRGQADTKFRRRTSGSLASEMNMRIRAMGIALVPANPWNVVHELFATKPEWSLSRIAAHLDVNRDDLNQFMGRMSCELARFDSYVSADDFMSAVRSAKS